MLMKLGNYREYISLPEFDWMTKLLEKGVVFIIVVLQFLEMVEILFGKLYKLLFSEAFAVGINMPTKAVVFSSLTMIGNKFHYTFTSIHKCLVEQVGEKNTKGYVFHLNGLFKYNQQFIGNNKCYLVNQEMLKSLKINLIH